MTRDEWQVTSGKKVRFGDAPQAGRRGDLLHSRMRTVVDPFEFAQGRPFHLSEEILELLDRQTGVTDNCSHRVGIDRIIPRHDNFDGAFRHENMFALSIDVEACLLQRFNGPQMVYAGKVWH